MGCKIYAFLAGESPTCYQDFYFVSLSRSKNPDISRTARLIFPETSLLLKPSVISKCIFCTEPAAESATTQLVISCSGYISCHQNIHERTSVCSAIHARSKSSLYSSLPHTACNFI